MLYISLDGGYFICSLARLFDRSFVRLFVGATSNERRGCCTLILSTICLTGLVLADRTESERASWIGFISQKNTHAALVYTFIVHGLPSPLQLNEIQIHSKNTHTHT